jgi:hypothetical protein
LRSTSTAGAAARSTVSTTNARVPHDSVDARRFWTRETRDFLPRGVVDRDGDWAGHRAFEVVVDRHAVRIVRRLNMSLPEEIVIRSERPCDALRRRQNAKEVRVLREDIRIQLLERRDVGDPDSAPIRA